MADKVLCDNEWVQLVELDGGYVVAHEVRCDGKIVAFLGLIRDTDQIVCRTEYCPAWASPEDRAQGLREPLPCSFTGGVDEGETPDEAVYREAQEEAGIDPTTAEFHHLGEIRSTKSSTSVYSLYVVILDSKDQFSTQTEGDGSQAEAEAENVVMSLAEASQKLVDPIGLAIVAKLYALKGDL